VWSVSWQAEARTARRRQRYFASILAGSPILVELTPVPHAYTPNSEKWAREAAECFLSNGSRPLPKCAAVAGRILRQVEDAAPGSPVAEPVRAVSSASGDDRAAASAAKPEPRSVHLANHNGSRPLPKCAAVADRILRQIRDAAPGSPVAEPAHAVSSTSGDGWAAASVARPETRSVHLTNTDEDQGSLNVGDFPRASFASLSDSAGGRARPDPAPEAESVIAEMDAAAPAEMPERGRLRSLR